MPQVQLPRAEAESATRRQDLTVAQSTCGSERPSAEGGPEPARRIRVLEAAEIVTARPYRGSRHRRSAALARTGRHGHGETARRGGRQVPGSDPEIALAGTENPLLPNLQVQAQTYNRGVAGTPQIVDGVGRESIFRGRLRHGAQTDLPPRFPERTRVTQLSMLAWKPAGAGRLRDRPVTIPPVAGQRQRDTNQIVVDISNQVSALRQSRARYSAARKTPAPCRNRCWRKTARSSPTESPLSTT